MLKHNLHVITLISFSVRIFTNLNKTGGNGPIGINPYKGTTLQREVVLVDGIQIWKVPFQGIWYFEVYGAAGGYGLYKGHNKRLRGGLGAKVAGSLKLREGEVLKILVGHEGRRDHMAEFRSGSGGGGTFVVSQDDNPLMVAGGGGGGGVPFLGKQMKNSENCVYVEQSLYVSLILRDFKML